MLSVSASCHITVLTVYHDNDLQPSNITLREAFKNNRKQECDLQIRVLPTLQGKGIPNYVVVF